MLRALSSTSQELQLNGQWVIEVEVIDNDGLLTDEVPSITVTSPSGVATTPLAERTNLGTYRVSVTPTAAGLHVATVDVLGLGSTSFGAYVRSAITAAGIPTTAQVRAYGSLATNWTDAVIKEALDTQFEAQIARCDVPTVYPLPLAEALMRCTVRALNLRSKVMPGDFASGYEAGVFIPWRDPIVEQLEAPYRKVVAF